MSVIRAADGVGSNPAKGDVALARDVLDHQLIDLAGVQVVRAADVYLFNGTGGWELAGIDMGLRSLARRLLPKTKVCPPPDKVIDWAQLHAFVARFTDTTSAWTSGPTTAAGMAGSALQLAGSAAHLKELRAEDATALLPISAATNRPSWSRPRRLLRRPKR